MNQFMSQLNDVILYINNAISGWPFIIFVVSVALFITFALYGVQFRYFLTSWKMLLFPKKEKEDIASDMTPLQSFLNALSASVGNGSIAGVATAVYQGGPGAALWIFVFGLFGMSIRFAEVFLATYFMTSSADGMSLGGPFYYLKKVPAGRILSYTYALFCFFLSLTSGNMMQANSIRMGFERILNVPAIVTAIVLLAFILYVMTGGAKRIVKVSDRIVPIKVGTFFLSAIIILLYHYQSIFPALKLIWQGAFTPQAVIGGALGYSIQRALRFGLVRSLNASEIGLGTAAIFFGASGRKKPVENGIMAMLTSFMSANLVCFSIALMIVASGAWTKNLTSIDLTSAAYETVFGALGGWIVTFLSVSFGIGVLVAYAYIGRSCWMFLTGGRFMPIFTALFCLTTFLGALAQVTLVWNSIDIAVVGLIVSNLLGILYLLPLIRKGVAEYIAKNK